MSRRSIGTLAGARNLVEATGEPYCEAELYRLWGILLLPKGQQGEAEARSHKAIKVSRRQPGQVVGARGIC